MKLKEKNKFEFYLKKGLKSLEDQGEKGLNILLFIYTVKSKVLLVYVNYNGSLRCAVGLDYFVLYKK
jgi:hypothetical protein